MTFRFLFLEDLVEHLTDLESSYKLFRVSSVKRIDSVWSASIEVKS